MDQRDHDRAIQVIPEQERSTLLRVVMAAVQTASARGEALRAAHIEAAARREREGGDQR